MNALDLLRRENAVQTLDFWLDHEGVPGRRRRAERREIRATLNELAVSEGMRGALRRIGPMREIARAVGEGYRDRPRWAVGAYAALSVFVVLGYGYLFSAVAFLEGVRASGVTGRAVESTTVMPWFGTRFSAMIQADHQGISVGGDVPWMTVVLPLVVFVLVAKPWRLLTHRSRGELVPSPA